MTRRVFTSLVLASLTAATAAVFAQAPSSTTPVLAATSQAPAGAPPAAAESTCPEMATALTALMRNDARLRDWPNSRATARPTARCRAARPATSRVVFMGDSITDAWQQPRFGGFFPGKPYVDRGISGQTTPQMLMRFRPRRHRSEAEGGRHPRRHQRHRRQHRADDRTRRSRATSRR